MKIALTKLVPTLENILKLLKNDLQKALMILKLWDVELVEEFLLKKLLLLGFN